MANMSKKEQHQREDALKHECWWSKDVLWPPVHDALQRVMGGIRSAHVPLPQHNDAPFSGSPLSSFSSLLKAYDALLFYRCMQKCP